MRAHHGAAWPGPETRRATVASLVCLAGAVLALAQQKPPVFRARTDLLQLDVTVLDKTGRPVRGLTEHDFLVLEDQTPQAIQGFTAVDLPDASADAPVWANTVSRDVASNEMDGQRIFVIVIDDARGMGMRNNMPDPWAVREMKKSAALFVNTLGPLDLAALVFTNNTRASQNLTDDHARLLSAIEAYPEDGGGILMPMKGSMMDPCLGEKYSVGTVQGVVKTLAPIPDRRKAVVYFGGSMPWFTTGGDDRCFTKARWQEIFEAAQQSHVTVNPIDTMGLRMSGVTGIAERYLTVAENTGGRAIVASSDFEPGIRQIFLENSSYYLMAYQPTNDQEDGTFRRVSVTVKGRPELEVRTRRSYRAPKRRAGDAEPPPPPPETAALAGVLPLSALGLRATAAPFAIAGTSKAVVSLAVGLKQPAFAERTPDEVELLVRAFTADGDDRGSQRDTIAITVPAARASSLTTRYELLTRIEVPKPGLYQIRIASHSLLTDTRGSVYVDLEVPDFRKEPLALSGVVIDNAMPAWPVAPARAFRDLMPVTPTTERAFAASDLVTAFVRVYQGGKDRDPILPVTVAATVRNAAGETVFSRSDTMAVDDFSADRSADYRIRLPVGAMKAGEHVLTLRAAAGKAGSMRDVRFQVK